MAAYFAAARIDPGAIPVHNAVHSRRSRVKKKHAPNNRGREEKDG
jgi:hypothetical protein